MKRQSTNRMLRFESLQARELMAGDAGFAMEIQDGSLVIEGTSGDDQVYVEQLANNVVRVTGVNDEGSHTEQFNADQFADIVFNGGEGDDHLYIIENENSSGGDSGGTTTPSQPGEDGGVDLDPDAVDAVFGPVVEQPALPGGGPGGLGVGGSGSSSTSIGTGYIFVGQPKRRWIIGDDIDVERWTELAKTALKERGYENIRVIDASEISPSVYKESFINRMIDSDASAIVYIGHGDRGALQYIPGDDGEGIGLWELWNEMQRQGIKSLPEKNILWLMGCETNDPQNIQVIKPDGGARPQTCTWENVAPAKHYIANNGTIMECVNTSNLIQLAEMNPIDEAGSEWALGPVTHALKVFNPF